MHNECTVAIDEKPGLESENLQTRHGSVTDENTVRTLNENQRQQLSNR